MHLENCTEIKQKTVKQTNKSRQKIEKEKVKKDYQ
jgi:hypothetical protein